MAARRSRGGTGKCPTGAGTVSRTSKGAIPRDSRLRGARPGYTAESWSGFSRLHAARILRWKGNAQASRAVFDDLVADLRGSRDSSLSALLLRAHALYESAQYAECREAVARGQIVAPTHVDFHGLSVLLAARAGDVTEAERTARQLASRPDSADMRGRHLRWLARFKALRGDRDAAVQLLRLAGDRGEKLASEMPEDGHWESFDARLDVEFLGFRDYPPFRSVMEPRW
jgi:hypothetical protein